jgi:DNA mismatch repair protein MutL
LKREFSRGTIAAQRLLVPAVVRVGPGRMALLEEYRALLEAVGITFDEFGPEQVAVRTVPALLSYEDPARILEDFLDRAQEAESGSARAEAARFTTIEETLEFLACRAAVRFGREMPAEEVERLLARRPEVDHAQACAHGRPIAVKITIEELDRIFLRK